MRLPRIKGEGRCTYGCHSRAVDGRLIFGLGGGEAKKFLSILSRKAAFMGIWILRCTLVEADVNLLCQVDNSSPLSVKTVLKRIGAYYGLDRVRELRKQFEAVTDPAQRKELIERLLEPYRRRMNDVSILMKEVNGEFAQWYNRTHGRSGVLWAERFKSVLLEAGHAVAAYIDLYPVRAGMCTDPEEGGYCGYIEALARGSPEDQENLRIVLDLPEATSWEEPCREHPKHFFTTGALPRENDRAVLGPDLVEKIVERENGGLTAAELWRRRIRFFCDGVILGSRAFVQLHFERLKEKLGYKRKRGPVAVKILPEGELWTFRKQRTREFG